MDFLCFGVIAGVYYRKSYTLLLGSRSDFRSVFYWLDPSLYVVNWYLLLVPILLIGPPILWIWFKGVWSRCELVLSPFGSEQIMLVKVFCFYPICCLSASMVVRRWWVLLWTVMGEIHGCLARGLDSFCSTWPDLTWVYFVQSKLSDVGDFNWVPLFQIWMLNIWFHLGPIISSVSSGGCWYPFPAWNLWV